MSASMAAKILETTAGGTKTITETARATTVLLDKTADYLKKIYDTNEGQTATLAVVNKHIGELAITRSLVQEIRFRDAFQTPVVASALAQVMDVIQRLEQSLREDGCSLDRFTNAMDELNQATINLRHQIPGDVSVASHNKAINSFHINAPTGHRPPTGSVKSTALGNEALDSLQINAPIYGDPTRVIELAVQWSKGTRN